MRVNILLLGPPLVERAGEVLETDTRKAVALVAYLAASGRPASRERLSGLLWSEYPEKRARAALRRTLSSLSPAREEGWLLAGRENVSLEKANVFVDVERFRGLLSEQRSHAHPSGGVCPECVGLLREAAGLYRDDFMAGFTLRDSADFDDWQFFQAAELRRELAAALEKLSRALAAKGDFSGATESARRWLRLDPMHEPAHRRLMKLYYHSGERSAALRQYEECRRTLEKELGVAPLEETVALHAAILKGDPPPPPEFAPAGAPPPPLRESRPPGAGRFAKKLFGREKELEALKRAYERDTRLIVIEGEAGIGKTRLAREFLAHVSKRGAGVLEARCYAEEKGLAYAPFVEILSSVAEDVPAEDGLAGNLRNLPARHLEEASRLAPELGKLLSGSSGLLEQDAPGAQSRFFEGVVQTLLAAAGGSSPGVIFLDDAQWADASSLELLAYLARRSKRLGGVVLLLARRSEEVAGDGPLQNLLSDFRRARESFEVRLCRLDFESVEELAASAFRRSEGFVRRLYEETEGLPLFLDEYLRAIVGGELDPESEPWSPPGGVRDLFLGRLATLGEAERQTLGAAAVIGRSFDFDTLREASGRGEEETAGALEELAARGLVREVEGAGEHEASYDFSHEKLRALVYEQTGSARRRILHRRVAVSLAESARRRRESGAAAARAARHYLLAGKEREAAGQFALAGEHAKNLHANAAALSHFRSALSLGHPDRPGLLEAIGDLQTLGGDYAGALESYEEAARAATAGQDGEGSRPARLEGKLGDVRQRQGEWDLAEAHYRAALAALRDGAPAWRRSRLYADLGLVERSRGEGEEAAKLSKRALELAEEAGDPSTLARTHNTAGMISRSLGDLEGARLHFERSLEISEELGDAGGRIAALNNLALVSGDAGDTGEAIETVREAIRLCAAVGDRHREAALHNNLADLLHATGSREESMEHLRIAVSIFAEISPDDTPQPEIWKLVEW